MIKNGMMIFINITAKVSKALKALLLSAFKAHSKRPKGKVDGHT